GSVHRQFDIDQAAQPVDGPQLGQLEIQVAEVGRARLQLRGDDAADDREVGRVDVVVDGGAQVLSLVLGPNALQGGLGALGHFQVGTLGGEGNGRVGVRPQGDQLLDGVVAVLEDVAGQQLDGLLDLLVHAVGQVDAQLDLADLADRHRQFAVLGD